MSPAAPSARRRCEETAHGSPRRASRFALPICAWGESPEPGLLHEFAPTNRREIIALTRRKVALRSAPRATQRELESGVPLFLEQLALALRAGPPSPHDLRAIGDSAAIHGGHLLRHGFTVSQVVHGYGDVCQAVTELAQETDAAITTEEFQTLNRCLDDA